MAGGFGKKWLSPGQIQTLRQQASRALQQRDLATAIRVLQEALATTRSLPTQQELHRDLGDLYRHQQTWDPAIRHYQEALRLHPNSPELLYRLGNIAVAQARFSLAVDYYQQALTLKPHDRAVLSNLAHAFLQLQQLDQAKRCYQELIAQDPQNVECLGSLAHLLMTAGQVEAAIEYYQQAILLAPTDARLYNNLGNALHSIDRLDEAILAYQKTLQLRPTDPQAYNNLGIVLQENGQVAEAIHLYQEAIRRDPIAAAAHYNLGTALLSLGDWEQGWQEYEWRWMQPQATPRGFAQPVWDGTATACLLLHSEQGLGDTLQFVRYVVEVRQRCHRLLLECQPPLVSLLKTLAEVDEVIPQGSPLPAFDCHASLLSLPRILQTRLDSIPPPRPFQLPSPLPPFTDRLANDPTARKIGIVWATGYRPDLDLQRTYRQKSCPLGYFLELLDWPSVALYSLQVGGNAPDLDPFLPHPRLHPLAPHLKDFADTAAAIRQLDLVISVDTAVVHLAGSLGIPTWLLLPFASDWRWLVNRRDSPWYPSLRLFRQSQAGDWQGVWQAVKQSLALEWTLHSNRDPSHPIDYA
ncbi:MAG: tetratricopeptide repeat protein [Cyanobacteriota bacterium]|nr:tetratricopeptide repeat protein [Cyanobacteriota bacterium]